MAISEAKKSHQVQERAWPGHLVSLHVTERWAYVQRPYPDCQPEGPPIQTPQDPHPDFSISDALGLNEMPESHMEMPHPNPCLTQMPTVLRPKSLFRMGKVRGRG